VLTAPKRLYIAKTANDRHIGQKQIKSFGGTFTSLQEVKKTSYTYQTPIRWGSVQHTTSQKTGMSYSSKDKL